MKLKKTLPNILLIFILIQNTIYAQSQIEKAIAFTRIEQYDSATFYFAKEQTAIKNLPDSAKARVYLFLHTVLWKNNQFDSAISVITFSIAENKKNDKPHRAAFGCKMLALDLLIQGDFERATAFAQEAIVLFKNSNDTLNWASSLSTLSNIYHDIAEYDKGVEYGLEAVSLFDAHSIGDPDLKAYAINCVAINYDDAGQYQRAIDYHMQVIDMMPTMKKETNKARTFNNIGNSLIKLGRYDEAKVWLLEHERISDKYNHKYGLATSKTNLGNIAYIKGDFNVASTYLDTAEAISYEINDVEKIQDVLYQQYKMYKKWDKNDVALGYLERYYLLKDSIFNKNKAQQIFELQTKFETEKKEQQIALQSSIISEQKAQNQLSYIIIIALSIIMLSIVIIFYLNRNRQQKKQRLQLQEAEIMVRRAQIEAALNSQEEERKRFARDLHDGFGQLISVLNLNLRSLEKNGTNREQVFENSSEILNEMHKEIKRICFNLMPETLIKLGLPAALGEFSDRINKSNKVKISLDFYGMEKRLSDLQEISLYRIVQEWVNNILKYAKATKITISITKDDDEITLLIEDNGIGLNPEILKQGKGNGWKNMNSRANLIKGVIEIDSEMSKQGTTLIMNTSISQVETIKGLVSQSY